MTPETPASAGVHEIRLGRQALLGLTLLAAFFVALGVVFPFLEPGDGFARYFSVYAMVIGGLFAVARIIVGRVGFRKPKIILRPDGFEAPCAGVGFIPWWAVESVEATQVTIRYTVNCIGIRLAPGARESLDPEVFGRAPGRIARSLVGLSGYDVVLYINNLEMSSEAIAAEMRERMQKARSTPIDIADPSLRSEN